MPECQHQDYQGNNYVLRACKECCKYYRREVSQHGGIDVYTQNVLTSHGSEDRPRFLDEKDPDPPPALPLTDLTRVRRRDRQQFVNSLTVKAKAANPPRSPLIGHWSEPTRRQMMNVRILVSLRHSSVPEPSVASIMDTAEWSHISLETDDQDRRDLIREINEANEALREHLEDANGELY